MVFLLATLLAFASPQNRPSVLFPQHEKLALHAVTPDRMTVPRYAKLELTLDMAATYDNPFDPDDINPYVVFTAPNGKTVRIDAFLYQPFLRRLDGGTERYDPA